MKKDKHQAHDKNVEADKEIETRKDNIAEEVPENVDVIDDAGAAVDELETVKNLLDAREQELEKEKKEYMFLLAEFDNFKKRTLREKNDIIKNAAENVLKGLLPIVDDFERGIAATKDSDDVESVKQGMELIYNKFVKYLNVNGVTEIPTKDQSFDADLHEAIAMVPVEDDTQRGKVIDTVEKGYKLNDKVIRHAKVAVGQ